MKMYGKAIVNLLLAVVTILLAVFLLPKLLMFFLPFVIGWIIATIALPIVKFFEKKLKLKRNIGGAVVIIAVIALVVFALYFIVYELVMQISGWISTLPNVWSNLQQDITDIDRSITALLQKLPFKINMDFRRIGSELSGYFSDFFAGLGTPTIEAAGNIAKSIPMVILGVFMALLSSYFFVADREKINRWFSEHTPLSVQEQYKKIYSSLIRSVGGYFKAQIKIEIWIYILLVIGLAVMGVNYFVLVALGIAFLDFLPVFGSGAVLWPWALIRLFRGDYQMALGLMIIWGIGQLVRQLIQPKIVGDSMGVPPLPTLFLLYIGYRLGGVVGMIIAVPLGILVYTMYEEGTFDTLKKSVKVLVDGVNRYRKMEDTAETSDQKEES